jgi:hypothetical protein
MAAAACCRPAQPRRSAVNAASTTGEPAPDRARKGSLRSSVSWRARRPNRRPTATRADDRRLPMPIYGCASRPHRLSQPGCHGFSSAATNGCNGPNRPLPGAQRLAARRAAIDAIGHRQVAPRRRAAPGRLIFGAAQFGQARGSAQRSCMAWAKSDSGSGGGRPRTRSRPTRFRLGRSVAKRPPHDRTASSRWGER